MMQVKEVRDWLETLSQDSSVGVDDGGLTLVEIDVNGKKTGAYCEVGGIPEEAEG